MSDRILITGGAGYIGSVLTKELLNQGYSVTVLDRFMYEQNSLLDCCNNENFSVIRGDIRDKETLQSAMKGQDFIIHLAALVGAPLCNADQIAATTTNLDASKLLLSLRTKDQKILYPCTNSGYGIGEKNKFCTEETPLRPISLYGKTKVEAEKEILDAGNSISFRLATVFGVSPRMRVDLLVNDFVHRAMTDKFVVIFEGHFKRNYIHIQDVARTFLHGIKNFENLKGETYNVGLSDANLSKLELCEKIKKYRSDFVYIESDIGKDPDKRDYIVSNEKIEKTGFKPIYSLDFGIKELMKAFAIIKDSRYGNI
ncbi:NAD-dependent epimerase/dehydratase family protein [Candidatus Nitrosotalea okcheonensis]|uniref:Nad dependent epimerase/dehydratase family n=1 Tax=Candidatus Nitrosotalea okcheonensis TaxID=1903276 RepID=A0A2H1FHR4_9ARCH|nr:NAD(P)-dependent oxidoreductase [Candidatus Nitrosotalea okcheonensis]SMH72303.1 Nad dependent epimerase/dehydratase family [Candidatus Nitrosotalea okcheonensis]